MSWWCFRVSTPFSLLCLILLTDFHKNSSVHPNMLNYLNTTFTFGKQTKDSFINRKFQCRPTYSFIHSFSCPLLTAFPLGRVAGTAALGGLEIPHNQQQSGWPVSSFGKERGRSSIPRRLFPWARNLALSSWANGGPKIATALCEITCCITL